MGDQLNQVESVSVEAFAAVVRDRGIFVRPIDGVLVGRDAPGAVEVLNPDDDTSICVSFPKDALCVNTRSPAATGFSFAVGGMRVASNVSMCLGRHSIVRLPCGSLLDFALSLGLLGLENRPSSAADDGGVCFNQVLHCSTGDFDRRPLRFSSGAPMGERIR